jgi:hypothetical protein
LAVAAVTLASCAAHAQDIGQAFRGKQIRLLIGKTPAGTVQRVRDIFAAQGK